MAIIAALKKFAGADTKVIIYSDSKNTVSQLNHDFAITTSASRSWQGRRGL